MSGKFAKLILVQGGCTMEAGNWEIENTFHDVENVGNFRKEIYSASIFSKLVQNFVIIVRNHFFTN